MTEPGEPTETPPVLHVRFPDLAASLPFLRLGNQPTPVVALGKVRGDGLLWLKDESGFGDGGWGGNKVRKLEWILPDAARRGTRVILTVGALGTNWGLATALYAREQGIRVAVALVDQPIDDHVTAQLERLRGSGATLHFTRSKQRTIALAPWLFLRHSSGARLPYYLPAGGSTPIGVVGYVQAGLELAAQVRDGEMPEPSHIVTAVGTGGTAAGLALGLRLAGLRTRVVGVVVNDTLRLDDESIAALANRCERLLRERGARFEPVGIAPSDVTVTRDWLGPGYGHSTPEAVATQRLLADTEDVRLETVYTAKAMAAALALEAEADGPVLVLNTYGPRD